MRKLYSVLAVLLFMSASLMPLKAEIISFEDENFKYAIDSETGTATVTGIITTETEATIPDEVTYSNESYPVVSIKEISSGTLVVLTLGQNIKIIESMGCAFCTSLENVNLNEGLEVIDWAAFVLCPLVSCPIPASVVDIKSQIAPRSTQFVGYEVNPDNQVYSSRDGMLLNKEGDTLVFYPASFALEGTFTVPEGIKIVGPEAVTDFKNLTAVVLPDYVEVLQDGCFSNNAITSVTIGKGLKEIGPKPFYNQKLEKIELDEANPNFTYNDGYVFSTDGKDMLMTLYREGDLVIPEGVENVNGFLFFKCPITSLTLSSSVKNIGASAFYQTQIQQLNLCNVEIVGKTAFALSSNLTQLDLGTALKELGENAFMNTPIENELIFPETLTSLGGSAFFACTSLSKADLKNTSVTSIGANAFYACEKLSEVTLPETLTRIEEGAFNWCSLVQEIEFPSKLEYIGEAAFQHTDLLSVDLPETVKEIAYNGFGWNINMTSFTAPGVEVIELNALQQSGSLTEINLGNKLREIGANCFTTSPTTSITFPATLEAVEYRTFSNMNNLEAIYCMAPEPPVFFRSEKAITFWPTNTDEIAWATQAQADEMNEKVILYVPEESVEAYKAAPVWSDFATILGTAGIDTTVNDATLKIKDIYDVMGHRLNSFSKGINIIVWSDGSITKVVNP